LARSELCDPTIGNNRLLYHHYGFSRYLFEAGLLQSFQLDLDDLDLHTSSAHRRLSMAEKTSDAIKSVVEGVKSVAIGKDNPQKQVKKEKKDKKKQPTEGGEESRPLEVGFIELRYSDLTIQSELNGASNSWNPCQTTFSIASIYSKNCIVNMKRTSPRSPAIRLRSRSTIIG
jgi:hypothetical protein